MREQNSIIKSVFSAVTAFFLCRPVHYPGALAGGRYTQENELNRSAAGLALAGNYPGARWTVPAGGSARLASVTAAKRPAVLLAGWRPWSPAALATGTGTRHPEKVYFIQLLDGLRARYIATFTIIGKHLPFFLYILNFSYQAVTLRLVTIFFDYKNFSD